MYNFKNAAYARDIEKNELHNFLKTWKYVYIVEGSRTRKHIEVFGKGFYCKRFYTFKSYDYVKKFKIYENSIDAKYDALCDFLKNDDIPEEKKVGKVKNIIIHSIYKEDYIVRLSIDFPEYLI